MTVLSLLQAFFLFKDILLAIAKNDFLSLNFLSCQVLYLVLLTLIIIIRGTKSLYFNEPNSTPVSLNYNKLLVFSVTPFKIDQNKTQNRLID